MQLHLCSEESKKLHKIVNPIAERNKEPLLKVLKQIIQNRSNENLTLLEISSGVGCHVAHFAPHFPNIIFQPSEYLESSMESIQAYIQDCPTKNICQPMAVDVSRPYTSWGRNTATRRPYLSDGEHKDFSEYTNFFDYILNISMMHISPYECTEGLFRNTAALMKDKGILITYGPYAENGILTPESNVLFDALLKSNNPSYGVRDLVDVKETARKYGIKFVDWFQMPNNNKCAIWVKEGNAI